MRDAFHAGLTQLDLEHLVPFSPATRERSSQVAAFFGPREATPICLLWYCVLLNLNKVGRLGGRWTTTRRKMCESFSAKG